MLIAPYECCGRRDILDTWRIPYARRDISRRNEIRRVNKKHQTKLARAKTNVRRIDIIRSRRSIGHIPHTTPLQSDKSSQVFTRAIASCSECNFPIPVFIRLFALWRHSSAMTLPPAPSNRSYKMFAKRNGKQRLSVVSIAFDILYCVYVLNIVITSKN